MARYLWLLVAACMVAVPVTVSANTIDPGIGVVGEDPPSCGVVTCLPISTDLVNVKPTPDNSSPTFYFYNDTGSIINSITFDVAVNANLTPTNLGPASTIYIGTIPFGCSQTGTNAGADFKNCAVSYNTTQGILSFVFSGVNPSDKDELCPATDCEVGEKEGIPPTTGPYAEFLISLSGWVPNLSDGPIYSNLPTFTGEFTTVPEPSALLTLLFGFVGIAGAVELRRRRSSASARF
jgi:hypothetical protein